MKAEVLRPNELRYGNLLHFLGEVVTFRSVSEIREDGIFWIKTIEPKVDAKNFHFKPIPLTEEWLLKFGWNKNERGFFSHDWGTNGVEIIVYAKPYEKFGYQIGGNRTKILDNVHQLQNLYFALTGEELTIKTNTDGK